MNEHVLMHRSDAFIALLTVQVLMLHLKIYKIYAQYVIYLQNLMILKLEHVESDNDAILSGSVLRRSFGPSLTVESPIIIGRLLPFHKVAISYHHGHDGYY